jgi:N-acetylmuramoyl-L-alanine amidase
MLEWGTFIIGMETLRRGSKGSAVKALQNRLGITPDGIFGVTTETSVKDFQKSNGLTVDGIVGKNTWSKLGICSRVINEIIVHCSATPEGKDIKTETIRKWHIEDNHWKDIGYHYIIELDGSIHEGRNEDTIGAHCEGHNSNSIGVCYIGGVAKDGRTPKDTRTLRQKGALLDILKDLKRKYPKAKIYGHRDFSSKACPSFDAKTEYSNL